MQLRQLVRGLRSRDWHGWPQQAYQSERYQQRLATVQEHLRESLAVAPSGRLRILSMCAGDGRDLIGVVRSHARRDDIAACLVELSAESAAIGAAHAAGAGLRNSVHFIVGDATDYATYANMPSSDVVLVCGVWGHVPAAERAALVRAICSLCKLGATVTWTRGAAKGIDRLQNIQALFTNPPWEEVRFDLTPDAKWAVATERFIGPLVPRPARGRIFNFQRSAGR